jgi:predicted membrane protein DUF2127
MSVARPDGQRTWFRRPLGIAVMAYKAGLGLSRSWSGSCWPSQLRPQATFARLSTEELREDPGDRLVALIGRHLPSLLHHRGLVAVGLIVLGLAKLVAAAAMWEGQEWGGYLRSEAAPAGQGRWRLLTGACDDPFCSGAGWPVCSQRTSATDTCRPAAPRQPIV